MFTGIVQSIGTVRALRRQATGATLQVETGLPPEILRLGDSVAVDGCCQTIAALEGSLCTFHCLEETLRRTVFGEYRPGRRVNIEPALAVGDRLGGHIVQGHVDCAKEVLSAGRQGGDWVLSLRRPDPREFPLVLKGSVALGGVSLTVATLTAEAFSVCLIPHTWQHTALQWLKAGDRVNLEADLVGRYVASLLPASSPAVTLESLRQAGF